jgi:hypothetical protein
MKRIFLLGFGLVAFTALTAAARAQDYEPPAYASPDSGGDSTITPGTNPYQPPVYAGPDSDGDGAITQPGAVLVTPNGDGGYPETEPGAMSPKPHMYRSPGSDEGYIPIQPGAGGGDAGDQSEPFPV